MCMSVSRAPRPTATPPRAGRRGRRMLRLTMSNFDLRHSSIRIINHTYNIVLFIHNILIIDRNTNSKMQIRKSMLHVDVACTRTRTPCRLQYPQQQHPAPQQVGSEACMHGRNSPRDKFSFIPQWRDRHGHMLGFGLRPTPRPLTVTRPRRRGTVRVWKTPGQREFGGGLHDRNDLHEPHQKTTHP